MNSTFATYLHDLRTSANLTNQELAELADVPESFISGLQNNSRRVGELQARKIGKALHLTGTALEEFILQAIDTSSQKVLEEAKKYPAKLLNLLARQLLKAGILAEAIDHCDIDGDAHKQDVTLTLGSGERATLITQLQCA